LDSSHSICTDIWRSKAGAMRAIKYSLTSSDSVRASSALLTAQMEPTSDTPVNAATVAALAVVVTVAP
jgi:hypothetical protein